MSRTKHLQEQAARAERLARSILDTVTVERLQAFAAECRAQAKTLDEPDAHRLTYLCRMPRMVTPVCTKSVQLREINRRRE
jgi:hypothetical protein